MRSSEGIVHIDNVLRVSEQLLNHIGRLAPRFGIRAVYLGQQCRKDWRTGRHFHHFHTRPFGQWHDMQLVPQSKSDVMAGPVSMTLFQKIDLQVP